MKKITKLSLMLMLVLVALPLSLHIVISQGTDSDLDGIPDHADNYPFDYDNDGMPDIWERRHSLRYDTNDAIEDPDHDGVRNIDEYKKGTDPLVSDTTGEAVESQLLLNPVEVKMVKILIWIGAVFLFLVISAFLVFRVHIFRVFKFMHHASRQHFEREEYMKKYMAWRPAKGTAPPEQAMPEQQAPSQYRGYRRVPQQAVPPAQELVQPPLQQQLYQTPPPVSAPAKPQRYRAAAPALKEKLGAPAREETPFQELAAYNAEDNAEEERAGDVFNKLSEHVHDYKASKKHAIEDLQRAS